MNYSFTRGDHQAALRIVVIYAVVAAAWIIFSDTALKLFIGDSALITSFAIAKGFFFILITGVLLYHLILRHLRTAGEISEELRRSRDLLQSLSEGTPDILFVKDRQGRYLLFNKAAEQVIGKSSAKVIGQQDDCLFPAAEAARIKASDHQVFSSGQVVTFDEKLKTSDGKTRTFHTVKGPVFAATGEVDGLFGIARDITERKGAEEALKEKNLEVERFVYTVSHDLKSPLITIMTFLSYLEEDLSSGGDTGRIETDLQHMRSAADTMAALIEALLKLSRLGRQDSLPERVTLQLLANEALQAVAGSIAVRNVSVTVGDQPVTLVGDRSGLKQIWQNLLENAVKFMGSQPAPHIEIGVEVQDQETIFFVCDNGIGIDPRMQGSIFGMFEKLQPEIEGVGLGLAMVKRLVELHQGRIWVESAGQGSGACFRFTLPGALESANQADQA